MTVTHKEYQVGRHRIIAYYDENQTTQITKESMEKIIIPALQKDEKYRWHDLQQFPEDLPDDFETVEAVYEYFHFKAEKILPEYGHGCYIRHSDGKFGAWAGEVANGKDARVIAWRYIEPFDKSLEI